jgi:hypothetical protein
MILGTLPNPVTTGAQEGDSGNQKALLYDTYIYARALNTTELESLEGAGGGTPPVETGFTVASELQNDRIKITAGSGNLTELSNTEYASNYFWKDGTIMYCNKSIWVYGGSKLWINDTDITEFRVASPNVLYAIHFDSGQANEIIIDGVAVTEWDFNTSMVKNTNNRKLIVSNINNTTINGFSEVSCNEMDNKSIISNVDIIGGNTTDGFIAFYGDSDSRTYDINIDTINIVNGSRKGLYFKNLYNATIQDIFLDNLTIDTVSNTEMQYISYSLFKNFTMTNCYSESGEQRAFFVMSGTDANQSIGNIYDNFILRANEKPPSDNGANGIQVEGQYNAIYRNLIIENSAHNLIDMHFSKNTLIDGFNINQTFSNGIIITGDYYKSKNLDNVTIKNGVIGMTPTGNGIHGHSLISNVTIENVTFNYRGIDLSCDNLKIINVSILNYIDSLSGITLTDYDHSAYGEPLAENNVIIDSDVYRLDVLTVNNANVINTHYNITGGTNFTEYFYINARCLNTTECPVSGAVMTFDTTALDGWGHNLTSVTSDEKGYFHITGNRSTFAALQKDIPTLVTVTKSGETDTATVTPDTEWYSTNTSTGGLSGTLYTFTLDVTGEGGEPAVEYFYGNSDYSYLDYPEVLEWNSTLGIFTKRFLLDGTILEEDAPERVTGVEVHP